MKKVLLAVVFGVLYLLWEFVPAGVSLVRADGHRYERRQEQQRTYRPQHRQVYRPQQRVYVPAPVYRFSFYPIYTPVPVYSYPRPVIVERERVVIVERPVVVEREVPAPTTTQEPDRCKKCVFASGDAEALEAVKLQWRYNKKGFILINDISRASFEAKVSYREIKDPQARVTIEFVDLSTGVIRTELGVEGFKKADTPDRSDAITVAARRAIERL